MFPDRDSWASAAEHYIRTLRSPSERVSRQPTEWQSTEETARLAELSRKMTAARDAAAEKALQAAIEREVARRNNNEGWHQELARRARVTAATQITTVTIHQDGTSTLSEPRPYSL
ncbi:hypothetical protein [Streptomyces cavernae]|uniref:hypothetical protein n=1 Tax=Streptomyces cavernae TaxID=2259034 RepID=UPI000FEBB9E1|nr:hypothetical protein [Streptomyces cavernae]